MTGNILSLLQWAVRPGGTLTPAGDCASEAMARGAARRGWAHPDTNTTHKQYALLVYKNARHGDRAITQQFTVQPVTGHIQRPPMTHSTAVVRKWVLTITACTARFMSHRGSARGAARRGWAHPDTVQDTLDSNVSNTRSRRAIEGAARGAARRGWAHPDTATKTHSQQPLVCAPFAAARGAARRGRAHPDTADKDTSNLQDKRISM